MNEGQIRTSLSSDGGFEILIDRPETGNVLTPAMTTALETALSDLPESSKFVVLRGEGSDFCAGRVSPMPPAGTVMTTSQIRARVADPVLEFYTVVRDVCVPIIAVVKGRAHGVGCALAGLADIVIADETAEFMIPEMNRDIPPLLVMTALGNRLSRASLARMVYSRDPIDAQQAVAMGLAAEACSSAEAEVVLTKYRQRIAANSRVTLMAVKQFLNLVPESSFAAIKEYAAVANSSAVSERFIDTR